jgi:glycerol-3-phosphate O-acyltransferase
MDASITLPFWIFALLIIGFIHAAILGWLFPTLRWYVRSRSIKKADKKNAELQIKIRPFLRTPRRVLVDRLINDKEVLAEVDTLVSEEKETRSHLEHEVKTYASEIVPYFNAQMYFNVGYWLAKTILRFLYRIKISAKDTKLLDEVDPEATIVFVMNHRSNIDYLLVSYLVAEKVTLSYAVGEWARVFPLEQLIKSLGAFFVRRKSNNPMYRKVLERYVHMATEEGVCQAVYLEGGLSRDGNFQEIKLGYLDYLLRSFDEKNQRDIIFIPIAINYDRVLEDRNMIDWGKPKQSTSSTRYIFRFLNFMAENTYIGARLRWRKFVYASFNFGVPVSTKHYQEENQFRFIELNQDERFKNVEKLGKALMDDVAHVMPVLPIPLLCTVLLENMNTPLRSIDLIIKVQELIRVMIENGAAMKKREQPRNKTLQESLKLLVDRGMVVEKDDHYQINAETKKLNEYYANSIKHWLTN